VYGLRLLRRPAVQSTAIWTIAIVLAVARVLQLLGVEPERVAYDFRWYWVAAGNLLNGQPLYSATQLAGPYAPQGQLGFLYPPPLAALAIPFRLVSPNDDVLGWAVWAWLAALVGGLSVVALARQRRLAVRFPVLAGSRGVALLLLFAFALPEVLDELINGNVHLFLLGLFTVAWLGIARADRRGEQAAGLAIGVATVIKLFPAIVLLWFLLTGRRIAAVWTVVGAAALSLATLPITGIQPWLDFPTVLANMSAPIDPAASFAPTAWLAPAIGFTLARVLVTGVGAAIVAWSARRQPAALSYAVAVLVSVLITPALWSHYLSMILLPLGLALGGGVSALAIGLDYLLLSSQQQDALGDLAWITARLAPTIGELLLLGLLLRQRSAEPAPAAVATLAPPAPRPA
jgi:alpha-1,2-mannosyltransferase